MDKVELGRVVGLLMRQLGGVLEGGMPLENAQIVVRPIFTCPDGQPGAWVMVNSPN